MAEVTSGLRSVLSFPVVYDLVQRLFGSRSNRRAFVARFIRPRPGDAVLDVGCGSAELLEFMPGVRYVGYDPNPRYIAYAQRKFGSGGRFIDGYFLADDAKRHQPFDIGILTGVLHHLDDGEAANLLAALRASIRTGGRLVTVDNVFIDGQNPVARKLIEWDRGKNVRQSAGYHALLQRHFSDVAETIVHKRFPPYTWYIAECS